jgi:hypothetical protein
MFDLFFNPEDGDGVFLLNTGGLNQTTQGYNSEDHNVHAVF